MIKNRRILDNNTLRAACLTKLRRMLEKNILTKISPLDKNLAA